MAPSPDWHGREKRMNARLGVQDLVLAFYAKEGEAFSGLDAPVSRDVSMEEGIKWAKIGDETKRTREVEQEGLAPGLCECKGAERTGSGHLDKGTGSEALDRVELKDWCQGAIKIAAEDRKESELEDLKFLELKSDKSELESKAKGFESEDILVEVTLEEWVS